MTISNFTAWPFHSDDEIMAVNEVLQSGKTNYWTGTHAREFENEYAKATGTEYAVALMNGTVALEAALYALDIGQGDEVITTSRTFIASASAIVMRGATPIIADVDDESQNMTVQTIESCITDRTRAIIVVHLAGWPADMHGILALAKRYDIRVIEDCAQAHGAMIDDRRVGSFGDVSAFSFCQDKIITTGGEGGMITTNDKAIWEKIWSYKDHGKNYDKVYHQSHPPGFRWLHDSFGTNWRMTEMQAAIGRIQLQKLDTWRSMRNDFALIFNECFSEISGLRITLPPENITHAYYKYYVFVEPEAFRAGWSRDRVIQEVVANGVPCFSGSCSEIYLEQAFVKNNLFVKTKPVAKKLGETSLMLLVHPTLTTELVYQVAETVKNVMAGATLQRMAN